jgi:hypothetical protein
VKLECPGPFSLSFLLSAALLLPTAGAGAGSLPPAVTGETVVTHARQAVLIDLLANDTDADGDPLAPGPRAFAAGDVLVGIDAGTLQVVYAEVGG